LRERIKRKNTGKKVWEVRKGGMRGERKTLNPGQDERSNRRRRNQRTQKKGICIEIEDVWRRKPWIAFFF